MRGDKNEAGEARKCCPSQLKVRCSLGTRVHLFVSVTQASLVPGSGLWVCPPPTCPCRHGMCWGSGAGGRPPLPADRRGFLQRAGRGVPAGPRTHWVSLTVPHAPKECLWKRLLTHVALPHEGPSCQLLSTCGFLTEISRLPCAKLSSGHRQGGMKSIN